MFNINYRDPRPIYEQVKDSIRRLIVSGALSAGEKLPSVRDMAASGSVNPNTIQRAYRELEAEGYIYSVKGKGSFAGEFREIDQLRKNALLIKLDEAVSELVFLGVSREDLSKRILKEGSKA